MGGRSTIVFMKVGKSNKGTWHPRTDKVDKIERCGRDKGNKGEPGHRAYETKISGSLGCLLSPLFTVMVWGVGGCLLKRRDLRSLN